MGTTSTLQIAAARGVKKQTGIHVKICGGAALLLCSSEECLTGCFFFFIARGVGFFFLELPQTANRDKS